MQWRRSGIGRDKTDFHARTPPRILAVCAHAGIAVLSYEDSAVGTVARRDGRVKFVDVLLRPKVTLEAGSDIEKARELHAKAHNICVVASSVNFPVRYEAEVVFAGENVAAA
jgi:organic hydroperoxide reductase OsmC/OhrA